MQISVDWLRDYVSVKDDVHGIAETLTMHLNEVDEIRSLKPLREIVVGEVVEVNPHPDADNLMLTKVRVGKLTKTIVCGAPNVEAGLKVPVALPGVTLPSGLNIEQREIRGLVSDGMICSPRELGISDDHSGIWVLPASAKPGSKLPTALGSGYDGFELEVLANRPDCMGHLGVAREVAAMYKVPLREPKLRTSARQKPGRYRVRLPAGKLCSRYGLAVVSGLQNAESPDWMKHRLNSVGLRPINAIVDITNYVMLEYGQPLHAMDADKLQSETIAVREARANEPVQTLDGKQHQALRGTVLITDTKQALGLGGIMGGQSTEVSESTSSIVLECAHFDPATIRRSARALGIRTDAAARFERGISEQLVWPALRRAVDLITEVCGGELEQLSDTWPRPPRARSTVLDLDALSDFLGLPIPARQCKSILRRLGCQVTGNGRVLKVIPPDWRTDLHLPQDYFEEIVRLYGYDKVPATVPTGLLTIGDRPPLAGVTDRLRDILVGSGLTEIYTHSLVGEGLIGRSDLGSDDLVEIANPLSSDHQFMRNSLAPRHLEAVQDNLRWRDSLGLFEIGKVFRASTKGKRPSESTQLLVTLAEKTAADRFAEARGVFDLVCRRLHLDQQEVSFELTQRDGITSGRSFIIKNGSNPIGDLSQYAHPHQFKAAAICFLELSVDQLAGLVPEDWRVTNPPQYPAARRDLSVYLSDSFTYGMLRGEIQQAAGPLLAEITEPEEYWHNGKRSLKVRLEFRDPERTLTDQEVSRLMVQIEKHLATRGLTTR